MRLPDYTALGTPETPVAPTGVARVENPAAAVEAVGQAGQVGQEAGMKLQDMVNVADVNTAMSTDFEPKLRNLAQNYYSLQGKAALDAGPKYRDDVTQAMNDTAEKLNGQARTNFLQMARGSVDNELYRASLHAGEQAKTYYAQSNDAALNNYTLNYQDNVLTNPKEANDNYENAYHQLSMYHKSIGLDENDPIAQNQRNALEGKFDDAKKQAVWSSFLSLPPDKQVNHVMQPSWPAQQAPAGATTSLPGQSVSSSPYNLGNVKTAAGAANNTPDFENPATPTDGVILAANNLRKNYAGLTLAEIAKKWTGEGPDKVNAWVSNVNKVTGIDANDTPDLNNPYVLNKLLSGMVVAEKPKSDRDNFSPEIINQGVQASINGKKPTLLPGQYASADNIQTDAGGTISSTAAPIGQGKPLSYMGVEVDPEMARKMTEAAISNKEHADKLEKIANEGNFNQIQNQFFEKEHNNQLTWADINSANIPVQGPGGKDWWQERLNKGTEKTDPAVFNDLYRRVNLPDGDPEKITSPRDLLPYVGQGITPQNKALLEKSMGDPEELKSFFKMGHDQLSKTNMIDIDGEGEQRAYNWQVQMRQRIADGNAAGISTADMLNPKSKNYIGNDIQKFNADLLTQQQNIANKIRQNTPATPLPADKLRRNGETPEEYVKRLSL